MKKQIIMTINVFILIFFAFSSYTITGDASSEIFEKVKISQTDIPDGFTFGKIPNFAKSVILNNPWDMNRAAINKLTDHIYPNADASSVKEIYMSILAKKEKPYGDDLVCYAILFKDANSSKKELLKIEDFEKSNKDRVITITKANLAIVLLADETDNYAHIQKIANMIEEKIK